MKKIFRFSTWTIVLPSLILLSLTSCTRKINFTSSSVVPAAEGSVKIKKDKNQNYSISINTVHLAQPDKLTPPKKVYIVWMETGQNGIKNIGQLKTSSGLLSKALKASLSSVSSFKPTRLFITAEDDANISRWEGPTVLTTESLQ